MEPGPIVARYRWTADEHIAAHRLYLRHGTTLAQKLFVYGFSALLLYLAYEYWTGGARGYAVVFLLMVLVVLFARGPLQLLLIRWQFQRRPDAGFDLEFAFDEAGLKTVAPGTTAERAWPLTHRAILAPEGTLLFFSARIYSWVPKHAFSGEADYSRFTELVKNHVERVTEV